MQLEARGLPIHTRTLSVTLSAADDGAVAFDAFLYSSTWAEMAASVAA